VTSRRTAPPGASHHPRSRSYGLGEGGHPHRPQAEHDRLLAFFGDEWLFEPVACAQHLARTHPPLGATPAVTQWVTALGLGSDDALAGESNKQMAHVWPP
jgi:hypothetical protein